MRSITLRHKTLAYRVMAYVTGCVLMVLVFVGIPLQIWAHNLIIVNYVGTLHGFLYIVYVLVAFVMSRAVRMPLANWRTVLLLLAGTVPIMTFVVERWINRTYIQPALAENTAPLREQSVLR